MQKTWVQKARQDPPQQTYTNKTRSTQVTGWKSETSRPKYLHSAVLLNETALPKEFFSQDAQNLKHLLDCKNGCPEQTEKIANQHKQTTNNPPLRNKEVISTMTLLQRWMQTEWQHWHLPGRRWTNRSHLFNWDVCSLLLQWPTWAPMCLQNFSMSSWRGTECFEGAICSKACRFLFYCPCSTSWPTGFISPPCGGSLFLPQPHWNRHEGRSARASLLRLHPICSRQQGSERLICNQLMHWIFNKECARHKLKKTMQPKSGSPSRNCSDVWKSHRIVSLFFSCIAERARSIVGQLLETRNELKLIVCRISQDRPKKKTNHHQPKHKTKPQTNKQPAPKVLYVKQRWNN